MAERDLLAIHELSAEEIDLLLARSAAYQGGLATLLLAGRSIGLYFEKSSTRTRVSFEVAVVELGGYPLFLSADAIQVKRGETIADTARVLSSYLSGLVIRTFQQSAIEEWARHAQIPVINGLTDLHHPCQILADLFTIQEKRGNLKGLTLAYIGDGNNVLHSLIEGGARVGMNVRAACPRGYEPKREIVKQALQEAKKSGAKIEILHDPFAAAEKADILYTDVWVSMGRESEASARRRRFKKFQINKKLIARAAPDALIMHCLPAHRGEEITDEAIDHPRSIVFEQAANRLPIQKAILEWIFAR